MVTSVAATAPGATCQRSGSLSSTSTPCSRRQATVISTWGREGSGGPSWRRSTPASYRGAGEQQTRDELAGVGGVEDHRPSGRAAGAAHGERQPSAAVVVDLHAELAQRSSTCAIGRVRACASPSKATGPSASAATGGTNRITVPASPQSTLSAVQAAGDDPPVLPAGVDVRAEGRERGGHQLGVA